jgi:hypothetical protein
MVDMKKWQILINCLRDETPAIVHDAKAAGFSLCYVNCDASDGKLQDRKWFIYATEEEFLRLIEQGQP